MSKLDIISLGLVLFMIITIVLGIIKIHTYPGKIAKARNHPQTQAIEVTSLLGLIAFPLWMFALIWAYSNGVLGTLYRQDEPEDTPQSDTPEDTPEKSPLADIENTINLKENANSLKNDKT